MALTVDDPAAFAANDNTRFALARALARIAGVENQKVSVLISRARRLQDTRRLEGVVTISYAVEVDTESAATALETQIEAMPAADIAQEFNTELVGSSLQAVSSVAAVTAMQQEEWDTLYPEAALDDDLLERLIDPDDDLFIPFVAGLAGVLCLCCCCCFGVLKLTRKKKPAADKAAEEAAPAEPKVEDAPTEPKVEDAKAEEKLAEDNPTAPVVLEAMAEKEKEDAECTDQIPGLLTPGRAPPDQVLDDPGRGPADGNAWCCTPAACRRDDVVVKSVAAGDEKRGV